VGSKEKVLVHCPTAEVERHDGNPDVFLITNGDDYISESFRSEQEAWDDAARHIEFGPAQPCHLCEKPIFSNSEGQKTRMGNLYCSMKCADTDWPGFNKEKNVVK